MLPPARTEEGSSETNTRQIFRKKLREGDIDNKEIEIEVGATPIGVEIMAPPGLEDMTNQLQSMFSNMSSKQQKTQKLTVKAAFKKVYDEETSKLINEDDLKMKALSTAEQTGIVFIDELDKVAKRGDLGGGSDISREGVQRDLLPLIEGCTVSTKSVSYTHLRAHET